MHPPSLSYLKVFGCLCYATTPKVLDKFSHRAVPTALLVYSSTQRGYILYNLHSKTFMVNRNVVFHEAVFPFKHVKALGNHVFPILDLLSPDLNTASPTTSSTPTGEGSTETNLGQLSVEYFPEDPNSIADTTVSDPTILDVFDHHTDSGTETSVTHPHTTESLKKWRSSSRPSKPHLWLQDYVTTSKGSRCTYHIPSYIDYSHISTTFRQALTADSVLSEPTSLKEAATDPRWVEAMKLETGALEDNHTWSIVDLPLGKTPIGYKWVCRIKYKASSDVERFKARLVAKGYSQKEGLDYGETFCPVAKIVIVRSITALEASKQWLIF